MLGSEARVRQWSQRVDINNYPYMTFCGSTRAYKVSDTFYCCCRYHYIIVIINAVVGTSYSCAKVMLYAASLVTKRPGREDAAFLLLHHFF